MWVVPGAVTHPSAVHPKHTELFGGSAAAQSQLKLRSDAFRCAQIAHVHVWTRDTRRFF